MVTKIKSGQVHAVSLDIRRLGRRSGIGSPTMVAAGFA